MGRILGNLFFFGFPAFLIVSVGTIACSMQRVFGPVDPASIDRLTLIRVMQLRDFRTFSRPTLERMTDRAEAEFGRKAAEKPRFEFSDPEKRIYAYFRDKKTARKSHFETNMLLMARTRYFQWMNDHEILDADARTELMRGVVDDMKYWETLYLDFLRAAELPIPSMAELLREFDEMIDGFKTGATDEEVVRIDSFKRNMNKAIVAREMHGAVKNVSDNVSSAVSNAFGSLLGTGKKQDAPVGKPAEKP